MTNALCKWRYGALGLISCLGLWQIFIRSQIGYAAAIYVTSQQTDSCKKGLEQMGRSSIRKMLGLWKSANMDVIENILGLNNLEAMIISSYDSLLAQAEKQVDLKQSLAEILKPQEEAIEERC